MRLSGPFILSLVMLTSLRADAASPGTTGRQTPSYLSTRSLLRQSAAYSRELVPEERGWLLLRLSQVSRSVDKAESGDFARASFNSCREMSPSWNRVALEKNAVTALSRTDSRAAMQLFVQIDDLPFDTGVPFSEDVRDTAAKTVFPEYYRATGVKGATLIRTAAQHLGDTGQYPYEAIGMVANELADKSRDAAVAIAADAIRYYRRGSNSESENPDFVVFLKSTRDFLPPNMLKEGAGLAFDRLQADRQRSHPEFLGRMTTAKGSALLKSQSSEVLSELLPILEEIDPELVSRTLKQDDELRALSVLGQQDVQIEETVTRGPGAATPNAAAQEEGIERTRLWNIKQMSNQRPVDSLAMANSLSIPELRVQGLAAAAGGFNSVDARRGYALLQDAVRGLDQVKDEKANLEAAGAVALAAITLRDRSALVKALDLLYPLGEELFEEDSQANPDAMAYMRPGFDALSETTRRLGYFDAGEAYQRVEPVRNRVLKAYLLAELVEGITANKEKRDTAPF